MTKIVEKTRFHPFLSRKSISGTISMANTAAKATGIKMGFP